MRATGPASSMTTSSSAFPAPREISAQLSSRAWGGGHTLLPATLTVCQALWVPLAGSVLSRGCGLGSDLYSSKRVGGEERGHPQFGALIALHMREGPVTPQPWLGSQADQIWDAQPPPSPHPPAQPSDRGGRGGPAGGTRPNNSVRQLHTQARTLWPEEGRDSSPTLNSKCRSTEAPSLGEQRAGGTGTHTHPPCTPNFPTEGLCAPLPSSSQPEASSLQHSPGLGCHLGPGGPPPSLLGPCIQPSSPPSARVGAQGPGSRSVRSAYPQ